MYVLYYCGVINSKSVYTFIFSTTKYSKDFMTFCFSILYISLSTNLLSPKAAFDPTTNDKKAWSVTRNNG